MNTDKIYAEQIANEYAPKESSKVVALKKLDRKAKMPALIFSYSFGIICSLIFGTGLCFGMKVLGNSKLSFYLGIVIGVVGIIGVSVNYLLYKKILNKGKQKYGSEIIRLAKEINEEE